MDLSTRLSGVMRVDPSAKALSQDGRWDTWRDLDQLGTRFTDALSDLPSDAFVAVVARNDAATIATLLHGLIDERPILMLNDMQPDALLAEEIASVRPVAVAAIQKDWDRPGLSDAARATGSRMLRLERRPVSDVQVLDEGRLLGLGGFAVAPAGCALSLKTSGTTSKPKRVDIGRKALSTSIAAVIQHHGKSDVDPEIKLRSGVTIQMLSLAHASAIQSICVTVCDGRQLALLDRFEPLAWANAVRDHQVVTTGVPPAGLRMILDANIDPEWLRSLRAIRAGAAPLDPNLAEEFEDLYGVPILQAYGATELQGLASWTLRDHKAFRRAKRGAVGRIHPGVEVRVTDPDTGESLSTGTPGLLEVRTAQASAGNGEWILTNDLARYDDDGFLWILGRADGAINRGGFKIDANEVVTTLRAHPSVSDAAVVAAPDPRLGQVPVAVVQLRDGAEEADETELTEWVRERLEAYKVPRTIRVVQEMPRTIALKPDVQAILRLVSEQEHA